MLTTSGSLSWSASRYAVREGEELYEYVLSSETIRLSIISPGATITSVRTPDRAGRMKNIVAGFASPADYWHNDYYLGCLVGRYANRIGGGGVLWGWPAGQRWCGK